MRTIFLAAWVAVSLGAVSAARGAKEVRFTLLSTNDIHGSVERFPLWSGIAKAVRAGLQKKHGKDSAVLLLDAGDQFQGTLLSNFS